METLGWLIISWYGNRHIRDRYNIHALFHGNTVTTESTQLPSESMFVGIRWYNAIRCLSRETVMIKTGLWIFHWLTVSLERI